MAKAAHWPVFTGKARPDKRWLDKHPCHIFVFDTRDALSSSASFEFLEHEIITNAVDECGSRHRWLWLTKRSERMAELSSWLNSTGISWPVKFWVGTTVTDQVTARRLRYLREVGEPIRPDGAFILYRQCDTSADTKRIHAREE